MTALRQLVICTLVLNAQVVRAQTDEDEDFELHGSCMHGDPNGYCRPEEGEDLIDLFVGAAILGGLGVMVFVERVFWSEEPPPDPKDYDPARGIRPTPELADPGGLAVSAKRRSVQARLAQQESRDQQTLMAALTTMGLLLAFGALALASLWRLFMKAGKPGWAALVPFYNWWLFLETGGVPGWLMLIPFVNFFASGILAPLGHATRFGKSAFYGVGLMFAGALLYPVLAFGRSKYVTDPLAR